MVQAPEVLIIWRPRCVQIFVQLPKTIASMEYGTECYCGNGSRFGLAAVSTKVGTMSCAGAPNANCRGENALSVYTTDPVYATPSRNAPTALGCFQDYYPFYRVLDGAAWRSKNVFRYVKFGLSTLVVWNYAGSVTAATKSLHNPGLAVTLNVSGPHRRPVGVQMR